MVRTRALRFLIILGLVALLIPVGLVQADGHGSSGTGTAVVRDALILGDPFAGDLPVTVPSGMITLEMSEVEEPAEGTALEAWLVTDDGSVKQSLGILEVSPDGTVDHEYVSDPGENLFARFNRFVITLEPVPDDDPEPSDDVTHATVLDEDVLEQIRLLLDETGAAVNLRADAGMAASYARQARAAVSNGDLEGARAHIDSMNAVIAGGGSEEDPGIAGLADQVVEAATEAGEAAGEDETVGNASGATIAAANDVKSSTEAAVAAGALASAATSTQVATLHIGNVVAHASEAASQAEMAYTGTQDMGTYNVAAPSAGDLSVGEPIIAQMVRYGIIASAVLVVVGAVMFLGARRRSGATAA